MEINVQMKFRFYHENLYPTNDCSYLLAKAIKFIFQEIYLVL